MVDRICLLIFFLAMTIASLLILTSSPHIYTPSLSDIRKAGGTINKTIDMMNSTVIPMNQRACKYLPAVEKIGG